MYLKPNSQFISQYMLLETPANESKTNELVAVLE